MLSIIREKKVIYASSSVYGNPIYTPSDEEKFIFNFK